MRLQLRRLAPGELDHELIWLLVTASAAAATLLWLRADLPWPRCTFHALVGLPCLTCGSTRAALALAHGDVLSAAAWNPLATVAMCGIGAFDAYACGVLLARARRLRVVIESAAVRRSAVGLLLSAALLNWLYLISRGH